MATGTRAAAAQANYKHVTEDIMGLSDTHRIKLFFDDAGITTVAGILGLKDTQIDASSFTDAAGDVQPLGIGEHQQIRSFKAFYFDTCFARCFREMVSQPLSR